MAHAGQEIHGQEGFKLRLARTAAGTERRYGPGETFEVPAGTPHQMTGEGPTRARWEVRPALRTAEFFERLYGDDRGGTQTGDSIAELFADFSDEIRITGSP